MAQDLSIMKMLWPVTLQLVLSVTGYLKIGSTTCGQKLFSQCIATNKVWIMGTIL